MPSKDNDYSFLQEPKKDWKKYYTDEINIISDGITKFYKNDDKKIINFYEKEIDKIKIYDIKNYNYGFTSRFFYGIYDFKKNRGWIRLNGVKTDEFLIKVGLFKEGYYDVNILDFKGIFGGKDEIKNWANIGHKKRFKNNSKECLDLEKLAYKLKLSGASTKFIRTITNIKDSFFRGPALLKKLFNSQLKLLRYIRKQDEDRIKIKQDLYHNDTNYYEEIYGYTPKERYRRKYLMMLNYLGRENRIILKLEYSRRKLYENLTEKVEGDESGNFIKSLLEIADKENINFKKRKKIILEKYRELFTNKITND